MSEMVNAKKLLRSGIRYEWGDALMSADAVILKKI
jgi:hypothetical protein